MQTPPLPAMRNLSKELSKGKNTLITVLMS